MKVTFTTSNGLSSQTVFLDEFEVIPSSLEEYVDQEGYDPSIYIAEGTITLYLRTTSGASDDAVLYLDCSNQINPYVHVPFEPF